MGGANGLFYKSKAISTGVLAHGASAESVILPENGKQ
jgi:hypothetical protein